MGQGHLQLFPGEAGADAVQGGGRVSRAGGVTGETAQTPGQVRGWGSLGEKCESGAVPNQTTRPNANPPSTATENFTPYLPLE